MLVSGVLVVRQCGCQNIGRRTRVNQIADIGLNISLAARLRGWILWWYFNILTGFIYYKTLEFPDQQCSSLHNLINKLINSPQMKEPLSITQDHQGPSFQTHWPNKSPSDLYEKMIFGPLVKEDTRRLDLDAYFASLALHLAKEDARHSDSNGLRIARFLAEQNTTPYNSSTNCLCRPIGSIEHPTSFDFNLASLNLISQSNPIQFN